MLCYLFVLAFLPLDEIPITFDILKTEIPLIANNII